jgi:hypothetical protein
VGSHGKPASRALPTLGRPTMPIVRATGRSTCRDSARAWGGRPEPSRRHRTAHAPLGPRGCPGPPWWPDDEQVDPAIRDEQPTGPIRGGDGPRRLDRPGIPRSPPPAGQTRSRPDRRPASSGQAAPRRRPRRTRRRSRQIPTQPSGRGVGHGPGAR